MRTWFDRSREWAGPVLLGALVALWLGAPRREAPRFKSGLIANSLPVCGDDQYLTYASGGLACRTLPKLEGTLPDCKSKGQILSATQDGATVRLTCVVPPVCDAR